MRRLLLPLAALALFSAQASAETASPWVSEAGASVRLVDAGAGREPGERLAAISIRLQPGWKTYWRQPGASGVPPRFDFSGSANLREARALFPAPERAEDPEGVTNVYHGAVSLPVLVRPADLAKPVKLKLAADIGVCERICVPVHLELALTLAPEPPAGGSAAAEARAALARVPRPQPLGATPLGVLTVERAGDAPEGPTLEIAVAAPADGPPPTLFAETGEGDYAPAPALVRREGGRAVFRMTLDEPEPPASGLRFTLVAGDQAVETAAPLDAIRRRP